MPPLLSYPGVYIEEVPSGVRTITGVATSITAFLGRTRTGPINEPVLINSFGDFERRFGGLGIPYPLSYAVRDFYINGGSQAIIVRLYRDPATAADAVSSLTVDTLTLAASSPGGWGRKLRASIDVEVPPEMRTRLGLAPTDALFNLTIRHGSASERFLNVTVTDNARRLDRVLKAESTLASWKGGLAVHRAGAHGDRGGEDRLGRAGRGAQGQPSRAGDHHRGESCVREHQERSGRSGNQGREGAGRGARRQAAGARRYHQGRKRSVGRRRSDEGVGRPGARSRRRSRAARRTRKDCSRSIGRISSICSAFRQTCGMATFPRTSTRRR